MKVLCLTGDCKVVVSFELSSSVSCLKTSIAYRKGIIPAEEPESILLPIQLIKEVISGYYGLDMDFRY